MIRILDGEAVRSLVEPAGVLAAMRELFRLSADPDEVGYGRLEIPYPRGWIRLLPAYIRPLGVFGFKTLHRASPGMRYAIYVHDLETGAPAGIVDGLEVTNLRTGAVTAVGSDHLAPAVVESAAIVGTGAVGAGQVVALDLVRPAGELRVYARAPEKRRGFIQRMEGSLSCSLVEAESLEEAIEGTQMVTLATSSREPILGAGHLRAGMHVNSVGPASLSRQEIDPEAFGEFDRVVCDSVELVFREAGDAARAFDAGGFDLEGADDLSALVTGARPGRVSAGELTMFKSVGNGLQDLVVARWLLDEAARTGVGETVGDFMSVKVPQTG
ncbi:MAG: ornithine cyclodeaminase family protein [Actinomycetota bacterium]